jgi:hypothetical protein
MRRSPWWFTGTAERMSQISTSVSSYSPHYTSFRQPPALRRIAFQKLLRSKILTTAFPSLATNHHPTFHHLDSPSDPCLLDDTTACWLQPVSHADRARWSSPRHRTTDSRPVVQLHMSSRPSGVGILIKTTHSHRLSLSSPRLLPRLL